MFFIKKKNLNLYTYILIIQESRNLKDFSHFSNELNLQARKWCKCTKNLKQKEAN